MPYNTVEDGTGEHLVGLKYDKCFPLGKGVFLSRVAHAIAGCPIRHLLVPSIQVYSTQLPFGFPQHLAFSE